MPPESIRCKQGNVRNIAHAVIFVGIVCAIEVLLPGRLSIALTGSSGDSQPCRSSCSAITRTAAAGRCSQQTKGARNTAGAKAARAVGGRIANGKGDQLAGTRIVPGNLGNI